MKLTRKTASILEIQERREAGLPVERSSIALGGTRQPDFVRASGKPSVIRPQVSCLLGRWITARKSAVSREVRDSCEGKTLKENKETQER